MGSINHYLNEFDNHNYFQIENDSSTDKWSGSSNYYYYEASATSIMLWAEVGLIETRPASSLENSGLIDKLQNISKIPDTLLEVIFSNFQNYTKFPRKIYSNDFESARIELNKLAYAQEEGILINELISNKRNAVLVPLSAALTLKSILRSYSRDLRIGKQTYADGIIGFEIDGTVPFHILSRIWAMRESGIIDWWHALFDPTKDLTEDCKQDVKPAAMSGNISVIFVVWCCGIGVSAIGFFVESIKGIISVGKRFTRWIKDDLLLT